MLFDFLFVRSNTVAEFHRVSLLFPTSNMTLRPLNRNDFKTNTGVNLSVHFDAQNLQMANKRWKPVCMKMHQNVIYTVFPNLFESIYIYVYKTVNFYFLEIYVWGLLQDIKRISKFVIHATCELISYNCSRNLWDSTYS